MDIQTILLATALSKAGSSGGGGGTMTGDYADLTNKPKINNVILSGSLSLEDIGIKAITNSEIDEIIQSNN